MKRSLKNITGFAEGYRRINNTIEAPDTMGTTQQHDFQQNLEMTPTCRTEPPAAAPVMHHDSCNDPVSGVLEIVAHKNKLRSARPRCSPHPFVGKGPNVELSEGI